MYAIYVYICMLIHFFVRVMFVLIDVFGVWVAAILCHNLKTLIPKPKKDVCTSSWVLLGSHLSQLFFLTLFGLGFRARV